MAVEVRAGAADQVAQVHRSPERALTIHLYEVIEAILSEVRKIRKAKGWDE